MGGDEKTPRRVNADATRPELGVYFRTFKASGTGAIEHGDRFHLVAMNGYYVRALGSYTTANATTPLSYGTLTLERMSIDSQRLGQHVVNETHSRWRASSR